MSFIARLTAAPGTGDLAAAVGAVLSKLPEGAPSERYQAVSRVHEELEPALPPWPRGLGTSAARLPTPASLAAPGSSSPSGTAAGPAPGPTGLGTAGHRISSKPADAGAVPELYCPGPVRDDVALGETVNDRLVEWAQEVGIYPGKLDKVREANVGRLMMLTHPDCDDADRLLAAARCALAEWATDDHYVDDEDLGADPKLLATRLVIAHAVVAPAQLPPRYLPELERAVSEDPVLRAYRSSLNSLSRYASSTQMTRLRHELSVMFVAYNQEAAWRSESRTPPVWEYLIHRHENSFLPCMVLTDPMGGYEVSPHEFVDPPVRRVFTMAGLASVLVNDLHSVAKEQHSDDFNLPKLIAAEEGCSLREAVERTVDIHDELMRTVEVESAALSVDGTPPLRRFLAGIWNWLGGGREWHRTSRRYNQPDGSAAAPKGGPHPSNRQSRQAANGIDRRKS